MKVTTVTVALALAAVAQAKLWYLDSDLSGNSFFSAMNFEVGAGTDNGGNADYGDAATSRRRRLIAVDPKTNYTTIRVGAATPAGNRESVRIISKAAYNDNGLFVFDVAHAPTGCGLWPALWMVGYDWPYQGELDIIEGVHETTQNMISTHTNAGCYQQLDGFTSQFAMSGPLKNNCNVFETENQGCGVRMPSQKTFGAGLNSIGGGTYAVEWDATGIATWFWPHGTEPADILAKKPTSEGWGTPANWVSAANCAMWHFSQLHFVININLGGSWAGGVWNDDLYYAGQSGSCAARTGYSTCAAYVAAAPASAFSEAYWTLRSVQVYKAGRKPRAVYASTAGAAPTTAA